MHSFMISASRLQTGTEYGYSPSTFDWVINTGPRAIRTAAITVAPSFLRFSCVSRMASPITDETERVASCVDSA